MSILSHFDSLLSILQGYGLTLLVFSIVLLLALKFLTRPQRLPPGPKGVPILGFLPFIRREGGIGPAGSKYGKLLHTDIVCIDIFFAKIVVLNTFDKIKEVFQKRDDCVDRSTTNAFRKFHPGHEGLVFSNGSLWKEHRRFSLSVLRDFGMGKIAAEDFITDEVSHMNKAMEDTDEKPINPQNMITQAVSNIICCLIFGKRYEYDDANFLKHIKSVNAFSTDISRPPSPSMYQPWMKYLPKFLDVYGFQEVQHDVDNILHFTEDRIAEHKARFDPDDVKDYIDAYLKQMQDGKETFTDHQLCCEIFDLFFAGTETTATTLRWAMYFMAKHTDIQEKIQEEMDSQVGMERPLAMKDKLLLPYTEAVLMEVQRKATILESGVFHSNVSHDIKIDNYVLPKGTIVCGNAYAVHNDPSIWPDADNFNPSNFYGEGGKLKNQDKLIPFAIGRRSCIGEALAKMELFLFFASWLQKFSIVSADRAELDLPKIGLIKQPSPFRVQFKKRDLDS